MSRAVIVGTNAYPYLIIYWLELAKRYWLDEVDAVYIAVSSPAHASPYNWTEKYLKTEPKVKVINTGLNWPASVSAVAKTVTEDYVALLHDDLFILRRGIVDEYFKTVEESGEVIAIPHPTYTPKPTVEELLVKKYPNIVPIEAETGAEFSFYINFTFLSNPLLSLTSYDFGEFIVPVGEYSDLLDYTPAFHPINSDTNFRFNLELYRAGAKIRPIPKYEITGYIHQRYGINRFISDYKNKAEIFSKEPPYIHLQTMAYHIAGLYFDYNEREALEKQSGGAVPHKFENEIYNKFIPSWRRDKLFKLALISEFMAVTDFTGINKYFNHSKKEIAWIIDRYEFNIKTIKKLQSIFNSWFLQ